MEWSNSRLKKGNHVYNLLMTTHNDDEIYIKGTPFRQATQKGYSLLYYDHSHPIPRDIKKYGVNIGFTLVPTDEDKALSKEFPNAIFRVYDLSNDKTYWYDEDGIYKTE